MSVNSVLFSANLSQNVDPRAEAQQLIAELQVLLENPGQNRTLILRLESNLRNVIQQNPGAFSNLETTDANNFCNDIEDYFMVPVSYPNVLGAAAAWLQNLGMDLAQNMTPVIPSVPVEVQKDIDQMILDMEAAPPNLTDLAAMLADLEKCDPKNLPALLEQKIQMVEGAVSQYLKNPSSEYDRGFALGAAQSALYALWVEAPHK
jgi:hypothetical protein